MLLGIVAVALVAATAIAVAAMLRLRGLPRFVLGAYLVAFGEVIGLILLLSAFGAVTRTAILFGVTAVCAVVWVCWVVTGRPRVPALPTGCARALIHAPILLVLVVATGLAYLYVLALVVGTPPNNYDSLTYHLTRAAFWSQEDGVDYIPDAYDERMNAHPPNAEIALTFVLEVGRHERLAALTQFGAALMCAVAVYAIARKLNISRREAAFGGLLFLTLPIVVLEASTTQNDLVVASFLVAATVFLFGESRQEFALAALATALAVGTKVPSMYGVLVLGALALVVRPTRFRIHRLVAVLLGGVVGSYWYIVNAVQTGHPLGELSEYRGDLSDTPEVRSILEPSANFFAGFARILDAFDLSGAIGADILVYVIVAVGVVVALALKGRRDRWEVLPAFTAGAVIMVPLFFIPIGYALWRVFAKLHDLVEEPDGSLPVQGWLAQTTASETLSWFGPLGVPLIVGLGLAVTPLIRRGSLPRVALVLAAAPLAWFVMLSTTVAYDPWQGRFFMYPVALSASLWGLVLRVPRYAVAVVAVAATTAMLSLIHYAEKPSGLRLLEAQRRPTVWGAERWVIHSIQQSTMPNAALRFLDELPETDRVALALGANQFGYPAFGPSLERHVELVPAGSNAERSAADWLLANSDRASEIDRTCWRFVMTAQGWTGFRREVGACNS